MLITLSLNSLHFLVAYNKKERGNAIEKQIFKE